MEGFLLAVSAFTVGWTWTEGLIGWQSIFQATFWLTTMQLIYFTLRVFLPMMNWSVLRRVYITFALSISALFWALCLTDKTLVHSNYLVVPWLLNHLQHTVPVIMALLASKPPMKSQLGDRPVAVLVMLVYLLLVGTLYLVKGVWAYRFLSHFDGITSYWAFVALCCGAMYVFERIVIRFFER